MELLEKRYQILQLVRTMQPIGRRSLTQLISITERVVRKQTDFLKDQGLLHFSQAGMSLTSEGEHLLPDMDEWIRQWRGLTDLEVMLQRKLCVRKVIITPGDSSESPWIKKDLGRIAVAQLKELADEDSVVAVAGGTTMAALAETIEPHLKLRTLHYVPARGGLGEDVENQAGTICSLMASRSGGDYRLLHVPDQLSEESYQSLLSDPQIKAIVDMIRSARIVVHGIGEARTMAARRNARPELLQLLEQRAAIAEAFGYYFNSDGQIVHKIRTIGLQLEDMQHAQHIMAVAGGRDKADSILAFLKHGVHEVLITDEGAARSMLT